MDMEEERTTRIGEIAFLRVKNKQAKQKENEWLLLQLLLLLLNLNDEGIDVRQRVDSNEFIKFNSHAEEDAKPTDLSDFT